MADWSPPVRPGTSGAGSSTPRTSSSGGSSGGWSPPTRPGTNVGVATIKKIMGSQPGGLAGLLSEAGGLVRSAPSGLFNFGKQGAKLAVRSGLETLQATGSLATGYPNDALQHISQPYVSLGTAGAAGWKGGGVTGPHMGDYELAQQTAGSAQRTYQDVSDLAHGKTERFSQAYRDHQLLGKIVEDVANLSVVGGGIAKGLDAAAAGRFGEAATARATAEAADRAAASTAAEATARAARAAEHHAALGELDAQIAKAPYPQVSGLQAQRNAAAALYDDVVTGSQKAAEGAMSAADRAAAAHAAADQFAGQGGLAYRSYRVADAIHRLGNQGAALPVKPFEAALKVMGGGWERLLRINPPLKDALATADQNLGDYEVATAAEQNPGRVRRAVNALSKEANKVQGHLENRRLVREFSDKITGVHAGTEDRIAADTGVLADLHKISGGDTVLERAMLEAHAGIGDALAIPLRTMGRTLGDLPPAVLDELAARYARTMGHDPEAVRMAFDYAAGKLDPETTAKIDAMRQMWADRLAPRLESDITTETQGLRQAPTDAQRAMAEWNTAPGSAELPPNAKEKLAALEWKRTAKLTAREERLTKQVAKRAEALGITPGVQGRAGERDIAAGIGAEATGRGSLGNLRAVREAARAEGRIGLARTVEERVAAIRDSVPASVPDAAIRQIVDAGDRFRAAQRALLDTAQAPEGKLTGTETAAEAAKATATQRAAVMDEIRNVRKAAVSLAEQELAILDDALPTRVPFVPSDLSEHHAYLHGEVGAAEANILPTLDKLAQSRGAAKRYPTRQALWRAAYNRLWRDLPPAVRNAVTKLEPAEIDRLAERHAAGTTTAFEGGLDTMAEEYLGGRRGDVVGLASGDPHVDVQRFLDDVARRGKLRAFVTAGKFNRWQPGMADRLLSGVVDQADIAEMLADPMVRQALDGGESRLGELADRIASERAGQAARPLELPPPEFLQRATADLAWPPDPIEALDAIQHAYGPGNEAAFNLFYDRWKQAGEPSLSAALVDMEEGHQPEWVAGGADQAARARLEAGDYGHGVTFDSEPWVTGQEMPGVPGFRRAETLITEVPAGTRYVNQWEIDPSQRGTGGITVGRQILADADATGTTLIAHPLSSAVTSAEGGVTGQAAIAALRKTRQLEQFYGRAGFRKVELEFVDSAGTHHTTEYLWRDPQPASPSGAEGAAGETPAALAALRGQESAAGEIGAVMGAQGGQQARSALGSELGRLRSAAKVAEGTAAKGEEAGQRLIGSLTESGARQGVGAGREYERYAKSLTALKLTRQQIDQMPEWMAGRVDRMYQELKNQPAYARVAVKAARDFAGVLSDWHAEMRNAAAEGHTIDPALMDAVDEAMKASIQDVRGIYSKVAGPGGELTTHAEFEPSYVPGGQPLGRRRGAVGPQRLRAGPAREENLKQTAELPRSIREVGAVLRDRAWTHDRNEAARLLASDYGRRAEAVLGSTEGMGAAEIAAEMHARGFTAWSPRQMLGTVDPGKVGAGTLYIPTPLFEAAQHFYGPGGTLEKFMRRYYDRPLTMWKAAVLALRPAWHVNNIIGNAVMAQLGGGMGPGEWASRMLDARAFVKAAHGGELSDRQAGRVARMGPVMDALRNREGDVVVPPRLIERGLGATAGQVSNIDGRLVSELDTMTGGEPGAFRRFVSKSYRFNGAVDDLNRVAVFLQQYDKLTHADLANMIADNPELRGLTFDQVRREGAVRMALKVAGDFVNMTPLERRVFRRVVPFYTWMRHITKYAVRLGAFNPIRVVWMMNLGQLFGTPSGYGLANTVPFGDVLWQGPSANPFDSVVSLNPREAGFNLAPPLKVAAGIGAGLNLDTMGQFQRPPGLPGGYGGNPAGARPSTKEALYYLANMLPQTALVRGAVDTATEGAPVMHYPLGQVRRTAKSQGGEAVPSGEGPLGPLARYLGVPHPRKANVYEKRDLTAWRKSLAKQHRPVP